MSAFATSNGSERFCHAGMYFSCSKKTKRLDNTIELPASQTTCFLRRTRRGQCRESLPLIQILSDIFPLNSLMLLVGSSLGRCAGTATRRLLLSPQRSITPLFQWRYCNNYSRVLRAPTLTVVDIVNRATAATSAPTSKPVPREPLPVEPTTFRSMGLNPDILNALDVLNVHEPTEIQVSLFYLRDETLKLLTLSSLRLLSLAAKDSTTPLQVWKQMSLELSCMIELSKYMV